MSEEKARKRKRMPQWASLAVKDLKREVKERGYHPKSKKADLVDQLEALHEDNVGKIVGASHFDDAVAPAAPLNLFHLPYSIIRYHIIENLVWEESWQDCTDLLLVCKALYALVKPALDDFARVELDWEGANARMYSFWVATVHAEEGGLTTVQAQNTYHLRPGDLALVPRDSLLYSGADVIKFGIRQRFSSFDEWYLHRYFNPGSKPKKSKPTSRKFNSGNYNERLLKGLSARKRYYYGGWG